MVTTATNFGRNGLTDYIVQRLSAVILASYAVFMVLYLALSGDITYQSWSGLFNHLWMRVFTLLALISVAAHAWIGIWAVLTDYVTERMLGSKALPLRLAALAAYAVVVVAYLFWGVELLWRM